MKKNSIFTFIILMFSCAGNQKLILYKKYYNGKVSYELKIPKPDRKIELKDNDRNIQNLAFFKDGAVLYITDNLIIGGSFIDYKVAKYGASYPATIYESQDTATLYGMHDGKYWREMKYKKVVVGYYGSSLEEKKVFDHILDEIIPQVEALDNHK